MKTTDDVTQAFTSGEIANADRKELEQYLIAIANARIQCVVNQELFSHRAETIRLLLSAKQSQELHGESQSVARAALYIALAALVMSALQLLYASIYR
jgi:hypothetical protein